MSKPMSFFPSLVQLSYQEKQVGAFVYFGKPAFIGNGDMLATPHQAYSILSPLMPNSGSWPQKQWEQSTSS